MNFDRLYVEQDQSEKSADTGAALIRIVDTIRELDTQAVTDGDLHAIGRLYGVEQIVLPGIFALLDDRMPEGDRIERTNDLIEYLRVDPELPNSDDESNGDLFTDIQDLVKLTADNPELRQTVLKDINDIQQRLALTNRDYDGLIANHYQAIEATVHYVRLNTLY